MGNQQKSSNNQNQYQIHDRLNFVKIQQSTDSHTGQNVIQMEVKRSLQNEKIIQSWNNEIMRIDDTQARQILLLPKKYRFQKEGMCGSSGIIYITYQNLSYVLEGQIKNRFKLNRYFLQTEIWYLLYNIIRAANKFQRIKKKVGNIHPNNILINDDGQVKIICVSSLPDQKENFQLLVQNPNANVFLAPEELANDAIANGIYPTNINPCSAEIFSIGMTILSAGTLLTCEDVYDKTKQSIKININKLQNVLKYFKDQYSQYLYNFVNQMICINPKDRKKASQIYDILYQYQEEILQLQPFSTNQHQMSQSFIPNMPVIIKQQSRDQNIVPNQQILARSIIPNRQILGQSNYIGRSTYQQAPNIIHSQIPINQSSNYVRNSFQRNDFTSNNNFMPQSNVYAVNQSSRFMNQQLKKSMQNQEIRESKFIGNQPLKFMPTNVNVIQSNYIPNYQFRQ